MNGTRRIEVYVCGVPALQAEGNILWRNTQAFSLGCHIAGFQPSDLWDTTLVVRGRCGGGGDTPVGIGGSTELEV